MNTPLHSTLASRPIRVLGVAALTASSLLLVSAPSAAADICTDAGGVPSSTGNPDEYRCIFSTPGSYSFTPPSNAIDIRVDAYGARGGGVGTDGGGGLGAFAGGDFGATLAGTPLTVVTAGAGRGSGTGTAAGTVGDGGYPNGGFGGARQTSTPGTNAYGAGGGGGSSVTAGGSPLVVAGGGGGTGADLGTGGNAGAAGSQWCADICGAGGQAATVNGPGAGGAALTTCAPGPGGRNGDTDAVGTGVLIGGGGRGGGGTLQNGFAGGGGGGGYHGGGGGGAGARCEGPLRIGSGGGGGGGSSYVAPAASNPTILEGASAPNPNLPGGRGNVAITYVVPTAPTVTSAVAPPKLSNSPFVVTFDQPVKGVSTNSLTVTQVGPVDIYGKVRCRDASDAAVKCGAGPVTTARFTPTTPLIAGEYYFVNVNEPSSNVVGYSSGLPVEPSQTYVRAQTVFDTFDYPMTYKWARAKNAKALGGSYVRDGSAGSTATTAFSLNARSTPSLVLWGGPAQGIASVELVKRGVQVSSFDVDTYKRRGQQLNTSLGQLSKGTYRVTVTVTGNKNAASTGTLIGIDGVLANTATVVNPKLAIKWPNYPGEYAYNYTKGTSVSLAFRGTGIDWTAFVGTNNGQAKVTIDGVVVDAARDLYSPGFGYQTFSYDGLSDGLHTVVITCLGSKQDASSDTVITIKGLTVE
jgi:hypothetical protein